MLDKNTEEILKTITKIAPEGYKIFINDDFKSENVQECINKLAETGYIVVKYCQDGEYLIALTLAGKDYFYSKYERLIYKKLISQRVSIFALIGSFFGCAIFYLLLIIGGFYA